MKDSSCQKVGVCAAAKIIANCAIGKWACKYEGALDYDHIMNLINDEGGRSYIAYCVGHTRGILQALDALG